MAALTVWCSGFREVRYIQPQRIGKGAIPPRRRIVENLGLAHLAQLLDGQEPVDLPTHRSAGPCGTHAHYLKSGSALTWSVKKLIAPLARYYATLPPEHKKLGAKSSPRGRCQALAFE